MSCILLKYMYIMHIKREPNVYDYSTLCYYTYYPLFFFLYVQKNKIINPSQV
jgi:hypothetical protein